MSYEVFTETRFLEELERQLAGSEERGYDRWATDVRSAIRVLVTELAERPTRYQRIFSTRQQAPATTARLSSLTTLSTR